MLVRMPGSSEALADLGLPVRDAYGLPTSDRRFPDGGHFRVEVPSVEGPAALATVLTEAASRAVPLHRVSQGSGVWMQTDAELDEMAAQARPGGIEVVLFTGPRAGWDTGGQSQSSSGRVLAASLRGADQLAFAIEDALRAARHDMGGVLVADLGLLNVLGRMRRAGQLPEGFALKVSVALPVGNPATARVLEDLGATSINLPVDLPLPAIAAIRAAVDVPLDIYIEGPDDFGAAVRHYELPEIVRIGAPVYVKFGVRNAPNTYPSGVHLQPVVLALAAERIRRTQLGLDLLCRYFPDASASPQVTQPAGGRTPAQWRA